MTRPRQAGSSASAASTQNLWPNLVNTIWNKKNFNLNNFFRETNFYKKKFREIDFTKKMIDANCCNQALMLRMAVIYIVVVYIIYQPADSSQPPHLPNYLLQCVSSDLISLN